MDYIKSFLFSVLAAVGVIGIGYLFNLLGWGFFKGVAAGALLVVLNEIAKDN